MIVARTDADAATLLDCNIDPRDHPFILGSITPGPSTTNTNVKLEELCTFGEAVLKKIESLKGIVPELKRMRMLDMWNRSNPNTLSNANARRVADVIFGEKDSVSFSRVISLKIDVFSLLVVS